VIAPLLDHDTLDHVKTLTVTLDIPINRLHANPHHSAGGMPGEDLTAEAERLQGLLDASEDLLWFLGNASTSSSGAFPGMPELEEILNLTASINMTKLEETFEGLGALNLSSMASIGHDPTNWTAVLDHAAGMVEDLMNASAMAHAAASEVVHVKDKYTIVGYRWFSKQRITFFGSRGEEVKS
jgi:hypothetical protein